MDYLERALELANEARSHGEVPVGAVIVLNGQVIGEGYNRREKDQSPLAHAEIFAIANAARQLGQWRLEGATLYVTLEPCPMCLGAIQQARLNRVIYGAKDPKGGAISLGHGFHADERMNHRLVAEYVENAACSEILTKFFKALRVEKKP